VGLLATAGFALGGNYTYTGNADTQPFKGRLGNYTYGHHQQHWRRDLPPLQRARQLSLQLQLISISQEIILCAVQSSRS
jgi:hypothetical protein